MWALIFVAVAGATPTALGTYATESACQSALRTVYEARLIPPGVVKTPQMNQVIDLKIQYQRQFLCVRTNAN
jgi:hypothetical protein